MAQPAREARGLIDRFKVLLEPDEALVDKILSLLGIPGFFELGFVLKKQSKKERDAAMSMVEQFLPSLVSSDEKTRLKARKDIDAMFEDIPMLNEDA